MDTSEIKEKLKCSLELAHIRSALVVFTFLVAAYIALMTFTWGGWSLGLVLIGVILIPSWILYGWRYQRIFRKMESYSFHRVVLSQPHFSRRRHAMYFTIVLETQSRGKFVTNTAAIFQTHGWLGPLLEDYVNREATVAYNEETQSVVIIG